MINTLKSAKSNRAFTLIELIVVIAVIGILVLLAAPKFLGQTEKAKVTQIQNDVKAVEGITNMERVKAESKNEDYFDSFSKLEDNEVDEMIASSNVYDKSGEIDQPKGGPFYNIPESAVKEAGSNLPGNFITNEDGKVYYVSRSGGSNDEEIEEPEGEHVAKDEDFEWVRSSGGYDVEDEPEAGHYKYVGNDKIVEVPHEINGHKMTSYYRMFNESDENIEKVISTNKNVSNMSQMFFRSQATELDLSSFDTSNVTNMSNMFSDSQATKLDLSSFDTSNVMNMSRMFIRSETKELILNNFVTSKVTDMSGMFNMSQATKLDLSSFDTSSVTGMVQMFLSSQANELDLSSFDTENAANVSMMFQNSKATIGFARTKEDAKKLNESSNKPNTLIFKVKQ